MLSIHVGVDLVFIVFLLLTFTEDDSVKELHRKRHSASPGVSVRGRVRKMAKWKPDSDDESYLESEGGFHSEQTIVMLRL